MIMTGKKTYNFFTMPVMQAHLHKAYHYFLPLLMLTIILSSAMLLAFAAAPVQPSANDNINSLIMIPKPMTPVTQPAQTKPMTAVTQPASTNVGITKTTVGIIKTTPAISAPAISTPPISAPDINDNTASAIPEPQASAIPEPQISYDSSVGRDGLAQGLDLNDKTQPEDSGLTIPAIIGEQGNHNDQEQEDNVICDNPPKLIVYATPSEIKAGQGYLVYIYIKNVNPSECGVQQYNYLLDLPDTSWNYRTVSSGSTLYLPPKLTGLIIASVTPAPVAGQYEFNAVITYDNKETREPVDITINHAEFIDISIIPDTVTACLGEQIVFEVYAYDEYENTELLLVDECIWQTTTGEITEPGILLVTEPHDGTVTAEYNGMSAASYVNVAGCMHTIPDINVDAPSIVAQFKEFSITVDITNNDNEYCSCSYYDVTLAHEWAGYDSDISHATVEVCPGNTQSVVLYFTAPVDTDVYDYTLTVMHHDNPDVLAEYKAELRVINNAELSLYADKAHVFSGERVNLYYLFVDAEGNRVTPSDIIWETSAYDSLIEQIDGGTALYIPSEHTTDDTVTLYVTYDDEIFSAEYTFHVTKLLLIEAYPDHAVVNVGDDQDYWFTIYDDFWFPPRHVEFIKAWSYGMSSSAGMFSGNTLTALNVGEHDVTVKLCASNLFPQEERDIMRLEETISLSSEYELKLTDIGVAETSDNAHPALFDIIDSTTGEVIDNEDADINKIFPGVSEEWEIPGTDETVKVQVYKTNYGYELFQRWAMVGAYIKEEQVHDDFLSPVSWCGGRIFERTLQVTVEPGVVDLLWIDPDTADVNTVGTMFTAHAMNTLGAEFIVPDAVWSVDDDTIVELSGTQGPDVIVSATGQGTVVLTAQAYGLTSDAVLDVDAIAPVIAYSSPPTPVPGATLVEGIVIIDVLVDDMHDTNAFIYVDRIMHNVEVIDGHAVYEFDAAAGGHRFSATVCDSFENCADLAPRNINVVADNPTQIEESPEQGSLLLESDEVVFEITDLDGLDTGSYSIAPAVPTEFVMDGTLHTLTLPLTGLGTGMHSIIILVTDDYGTITEFVFNYGIGSPPVITVFSPVPMILSPYAGLLGFDVKDVDGSILVMPEYSWDGINYEPFTYVHEGYYYVDYPENEPGNMLPVYIRAVDNDGFETIELFEFTYVAHGTVIFMPECGSELLLEDDVSITIEGERPVGGAEWAYITGLDDSAWDDVTWYPYTGPIIIDDSYPEGDITMYVRWEERIDSGTGPYSFVPVPEACFYNVNYAPVVNLEWPEHDHVSIRWGDTIILDITDFDGIDPDRSWYQWDHDYEIRFTDPYNIVVDERLVEIGEHTLKVHIVDQSSNALVTEREFTFYRAQGPGITWSNRDDIIIKTVDSNDILIASANGGADIMLNLVSEADIAELWYKWDDVLPVMLPNIVGDHCIEVPVDYGYGEHTLTVHAQDEFGFTNEQVYNIIIERYPEITSVNPADGALIEGIDYILFTVEDNSAPLSGIYKWNEGLTIVFDYDGTYYTASTMFAHPDANTLWVRFCDEYELCTEHTYTFNGAPGMPWMSVTPATGSNVDDSTEVHVDAYDSEALDRLEYVCNSDAPVAVDLEGIEDAVVFTCPWVHGLNTVDISVYDSDSNFVTWRYEYNYGVTDTGNINGIVYEYNPVTMLFDAVLPNADITIVELGIATVSNADGEYWFEDVAPGIYTLKSEKTGYMDFEVSGVIVRSAHTFEQDLYMTPYADLEVTVINAFTANPIENADVEITYELTGIMAGSGVTGSDGKVWFTDIEPGWYTVAVEKTGYSPMSISGMGVRPGITETITVPLY